MWLILQILAAVFVDVLGDDLTSHPGHLQPFGWCGFKRSVIEMEG